MSAKYTACLFNFLGDVGGFFSVIWGAGFYICYFVSQHSLNIDMIR
jgi:hypothetical protein